MKPTLFIHIPKTAGTSLIKSVTDAIGNVATEMDYGPVSKDYGPNGRYSSKLIQQYIYEAETPDQFAYHAAFEREKKQFLCGHFFFDAHLNNFGAEKTISFVRDPIDRVISEYKYLSRTHALDRSLEEFYRAPEETNKQYRMIGQVPWQAFHLVGTLSQYTQCLDVLSESRGLTLSENAVNIAPLKTSDTVNETVRADIRKWNERDCSFVEDVEKYLQKRLQAYQEGKAFCFHDFGFIPDRHIIGWAFYSESDQPVTLELYADGKVVADIKGCEHRAELQVLKTPRAGHSGFRFELQQYTSASHIELKARETEQTLLSWLRA